MVEWQGCVWQLGVWIPVHTLYCGLCWTRADDPAVLKPSPHGQSYCCPWATATPVLSRMALILTFILLSATDSRSSPATELAFLTCWDWTVHWLLQTGRRSSVACCTHWRIWVSSWRTGCYIPSWRGCQCCEISPFLSFTFSLFGPEDTCMSTPSPLPLPGSPPPALWSCWFWAWGDCCYTMWRSSLSPLYSLCLCRCIQQWRSHRKTFGGGRNQSCNECLRQRVWRGMVPVQFLEVCQGC